ncbi:centrosomal protein of 135 kDa [Leptidea sinapis]|uniref:centrosomal protein of 135 kDa n=1 Tax=Leptidea sinapis TaxID=189913 RepID=UPI0021337683|nr:centrosomal protein of 135 kDa [Leptidea sinapis]
MADAYLNLQRKLKDLGYNNTLPKEATALVENILADLLQTTRSLQHYMTLSKETLLQRDSLLLEIEPYKSDNANLIQENNRLHRELMQLKENHLKTIKDNQRTIKNLTDDIARKDSLILKLQHDLRDLSLRGLCAETLSSRNRSKRKDAGDTGTIPRLCICNSIGLAQNKDSEDISRTLKLMQEKIDAYNDEIMILKSVVDHRDNEIARLNILLQGGRPFTAINKDFYSNKPENKILSMHKQLKDLETVNESLQKELESNLEKQHEAMLRALDLADKNKKLKEELQRMDSLALKVEEDCNKRLADMLNENNILQSRIDTLLLKKSQLERDLSERNQKQYSYNESGSLNWKDLNEKASLQNEIKDLVELNKSLQEKIYALSQVSREYQNKLINNYETMNPICLGKNELQKMFEDERKKYEKYITQIQEKLNETIKFLENKSVGNSPKFLPENSFIKDLNLKLCEAEQRCLMLKKENDELKSKVTEGKDYNKNNNYKDIINHLNIENSELSKENIFLTQQLSKFKSTEIGNQDKNKYFQQESNRLQEKIDILSKEIETLKREKHEYNMRYNDALDKCDKLKKDLVFKQNQIAQLEEENCSYKLTNRSGKASRERYKEENIILKEQIKKLQSELITEKTVANQIRNVQLETERSTTETQNTLFSIQKKLSLAKDSIENLEKRCKEYQSEILMLRADKANLVENIKKIDEARDKLVLELDQKAEDANIMEQKLQSKLFEITKLDTEIAHLKRKLSVSKISEHKISDYESQISFLNGEILKLNQQFDTSIIENKHLQNSLADANGMLRLTKIELEKSRKEVDGLKQQLQHYVAEVRRIEELLSHKETERSDMLEQFASLSVEANILENTNHSLENETASKSLQLQSYISKIESLEEKLIEKDNIIDSQTSRIASMTCKINALENEVKLITEEKLVLEQNVQYLKSMCNDMKADQTKSGIGNGDSELKLYESRIRALKSVKEKLEAEKLELKEKLLTAENLLSNARREIVDLKLTLQDATSETKSLKDRVNRFNIQESDSDINENVFLKEELELPLLLGSPIQEDSNEYEECSPHLHGDHKTYSKYRYGTL